MDRRAIIADRVVAHQERVVRSEVAAAQAKFLIMEPLVSAAQDLIDLLANEESRFMFGLAELDTCIRGVGRGELCYLTGRAHAGKTLLVENAILRQPERHVLWLTPDETKAAVMAQLVGLVHGVNYEELERRFRQGDRRVKQLIWATAEECFPNLLINERALTFAEMTMALEESREIWQADCETVVVDYLDLLPGPADYHGTKRKSLDLKEWIKEHNQGSVTMHQPRRGGAARGTAIGMDDMANAGETEATYVLGVHRKRDDDRADDEDRRRHMNTISVNLSKNKRPPSKKGCWDFFLHPETGRIRQLAPEDLIVPGIELHNARDAVAAHARWQAERARPLFAVQ